MKTINMKKVLVILVIALMLITVATTVLGYDDIGTYNGTTDSPAAKSASTIINIVLGVVKVVAVGIAVIMLVVLAIKYMTAAPGEKADIKKSAFTYVIGALLLFGGAAVLQMIQYAGDQAANTTAIYEVQSQVQSIDKLG